MIVCSHVVSDVSQPPPRTQWHSPQNSRAEADELTLDDEGRKLATPSRRTLPYDPYVMHEGLAPQTRSDQSARNNTPVASAIPRRYFEDHVSTDLSEEGYIFEPESSYPQFLKTDAQLHNMQRRRRDERWLAELREDAEAVRLKVRQARTALRRDRATFRDKEARAMDYLQAAQKNSNIDAILSVQREIEDLKDSLDALNMREDEYNELEDHLLSDEWEMRQAESAVYGVATETAPTSASARLLTVQQRRRALASHLEGLRKQYQLLSKERESRARLRRDIDTVSIQILDDFPEQEKGLLIELSMLEDDEIHLEPIVGDQNDSFFEARNLIGNDEDISIREVRTLENDFPVSGVSMNRIVEERTATNELFSSPTMKPSSLLSGFLFYSHLDIIKKADSLNVWLLQVLRSSALQMQRYLITVKLPEFSDHMDFPQVRALVVGNWFHDATNKDYDDPEACDDLSEESSPKTKGTGPSAMAPKRKSPATSRPCSTNDLSQSTTGASPQLEDNLQAGNEDYSPFPQETPARNSESLAQETILQGIGMV